MTPSARTLLDEVLVGEREFEFPADAVDALFQSHPTPNVSPVVPIPSRLRRGPVDLRARKRPSDLTPGWTALAPLSRRPKRRFLPAKPNAAGIRLSDSATFAGLLQETKVVLPSVDAGRRVNAWRSAHTVQVALEALHEQVRISNRCWDVRELDPVPSTFVPEVPERKWMMVSFNSSLE
jgi:hypothetical protein